MKKLLGVTLLLLGLGFSTTVEAQEKFEINEENRNLIAELSASEPANKDYIESTINMYYDAPSENDSAEDFNSFLNSALSELDNFDSTQDEKLEDVIESSDLPQKRVITPYPTAIAAYKAGIAVVDRMGHWQTANYMRRAIVPLDKIGTNYTPATYYNKDDTWARMVDSESLMTAYYSRLKAEAFRGGRSSGSFSGTHTFPSGHLMTALRGVSYTVSYKKQANGNYFTTVKVTDIFDFKWEVNGYSNNFGVGFGNNYCVFVQTLGAIKPYKIEIVRTMSR
ncbi:hypothetical protein [Enterococcus wangshanyuanii]|uniref:SCP domain-containing protein n=1 Tax=Enterococcus wangshanyuanii TaxID=2005703 RepID=A0ABQ1PAC5_9ENTE|nr:hypothetical protein [Enterococcus wangshanyuanii]GGC93546.1 hypothetical protein GCM10011573_23970 [Enterococcus wangshanyuanii]